MFGNPVITPAHVSVPEFFKGNEHLYLVDAYDLPVGNMPPQWSRLYNGTQLWGDPDLMQVRKHMRGVYENQEEAKKKAAVAKKYIEDTYNLEASSRVLAETLLEVIDG